jgi:hypothetical protein
MYKTEYRREHYYYHRTDPTPWIAFEQEKRPANRFLVALALGFLLLVLL